MPSLAKRVWNYGEAVARWMAAGSPTCTQEQIGERLAICRECPFFMEDSNHCSKCGCPLGSGKDALRNKLAMATEECPHPDGPKWRALA